MSNMGPIENGSELRCSRRASSLCFL